MAGIPIPQPNNHTETNLIRPGGSISNYTTTNKVESNKIEPKPLKGGISKKKLTFGEKLKRSFVKEDIKDIRDYLIFDLIIPNARKAIFDTIVGTAAQVFGVSVPRGSFTYSDGYSPANARLTPHERKYRDYNSISRNNALPPARLAQTDNRFYVADYPFTYKEDAESVLEQLMDICDTYGWVSVATFFELADPEGTIEGRNAYTNNAYGWDNVDGATVKFDGSGYFINLPKAIVRR